MKLEVLMKKDDRLTICGNRVMTGKKRPLITPNIARVIQSIAGEVRLNCMMRDIPPHVEINLILLPHFSYFTKPCDRQVQLPIFTGSPSKIPR